MEKSAIPPALWFFLLMMSGEMTLVTSRRIEPVVARYKKTRMTQNGPVMCPLDKSNKTVSSSSLLGCSASCTRDDTCQSFNVRDPHTCDLYNFKPGVLALVPGCINYRRYTNDDIDCLEYDASSTSIPSKCCAMPYILNGGMHFSCSVNSAVSSESGCYNDNGQWVTCLQPDEFVAEYMETATTALCADPAVSVPLLTINGWILMQRKVPGGSMSFNQNWAEYRYGFGSAAGNDNYWLGLEWVYRLMQLTSCKLRVEIQRTNGQWYFAEYTTFLLSDEAGMYKLTVAGYSGDAGDALAGAAAPNWIANGRMFSTPDRDNDIDPLQCSEGRRAWWYGKCGTSELTFNGNNPGIWTTSGNPSWNVQASRMLVKLVYV